ncbi:MAG: hypothetical protein IPN01_18765 [Deltaproteobacteria bacterium]|nr:hypothetical protein [Deltaproteobacteria bacterium]
MLRPLAWFVVRVFPKDDEAVRERRIRAFGRGLRWLSRPFVGALVFIGKPIFLLVKSRVERILEREISEERQRFISQRGEDHCKPNEDLKALLEPANKSQEASIQSASDLALLTMLTMLGEFLMDGTTRPSVNGSSLVEASVDDSTSRQIARFAKVLASRSWHSPPSVGNLPVRDAAWGLRVALLLGWRYTATAGASALKRAKDARNLPDDETTARHVSLWLEAWIIEHRASGAEKPFEAIRIVKVRRHLE